MSLVLYLVVTGRLLRKIDEPRPIAVLYLSGGVLVSAKSPSPAAKLKVSSFLSVKIGQDTKFEKIN